MSLSYLTTMRITAPMISRATTKITIAATIPPTMTLPLVLGSVGNKMKREYNYISHVIKNLISSRQIAKAKTSVITLTLVHLHTEGVAGSPGILSLATILSSWQGTVPHSSEC